MNVRYETCASNYFGMLGVEFVRVTTIGDDELTREVINRQLIDTRQPEVQRELMKMGWTPPLGQVWHE